MRFTGAKSLQTLIGLKHSRHCQGTGAIAIPSLSRPDSPRSSTALPYHSDIFNWTAKSIAQRANPYASLPIRIATDTHSM